MNLQAARAVLNDLEFEQSLLDANKETLAAIRKALQALDAIEEVEGILRHGWDDYDTKCHMSLRVVEKVISEERSSWMLNDLVRNLEQMAKSELAHVSLTASPRRWQALQEQLKSLLEDRKSENGELSPESGSILITPDPGGGDCSGFTIVSENGVGDQEQEKSTREPHRDSQDG